jgi:hypothetical protein
MTTELKNEIENISKEFTKGMGIEIKGSTWLVVDPLSAYLNACGYKNELKQLPEKEKRPLVLMIIFEDGTQFIPAGSDLNNNGITSMTDWFWLDKYNS